MFPKKKRQSFDKWYETVPKEINDTTNYNLRMAYELLPFSEMEKFRKGKAHLRSVAPTKDGNYQFLKSKNHPTYKYEVDWYNSPDGKFFRDKYYLDDSTEYPRYIIRKANGGILVNKRNLKPR